MIAPAFALAVAAIAFPAGDPIKVDAALDLVPAEALGVIVVADPKAASDDIAQCLERMERPEVAIMGRPIDLLKAQACIGAGFDDRGPVVAWWQAVPGGEAPPEMVMVVGTTDPLQFLEANFTRAAHAGEDAWERDGVILHAKTVDKLVAMSPSAALVRGWSPKPGFAAQLRNRLGERALTIVHDAEFSAWAGPEALRTMRERSLAEAKAQPGVPSAELDRFAAIGEGMRDALVAIDVDPLGLSIRTMSVFDPESRMGKLTRGGATAGEGVDRLPGGPHYLALSVDVRGLGGGGPFMELLSLLGAESMLPPWMAEHRDLVDRVQVGLYPSKLGLASGLLNDSAIFVQTKDPEKVKSLWRDWIRSLSGSKDGVTRTAVWEESRTLKSGGEVSAFAVTEEMDADAAAKAGDEAMSRMARQLVIGPKGFIGFMRVVPGGVVMTLSQRTDVLGRATEAAAGRSTLAESGTVRALRRWLIPGADLEGFVGVGPIIKMASAAAASFGLTSAVIEVPENLEPIAFAMQVQDGRVETAAMVPTGVLAIAWDQAKARLMPAPPPSSAPADAPAHPEAPAKSPAGDRP